MITAVDFGCSVMRCLFRDPNNADRLQLFAEQSEYAAISQTPEHSRSLKDEGVAFAECQDALVVVGNNVGRVGWLSRLPLTSLFDDGRVPFNDPPARQLLNVLLESMLPPGTDQGLCAVTVPAGNGSLGQLKENCEFLSRLIRIRGYQPLIVHPAEAAMLATGAGAAFCGISVVVGAQSCSVAIARLGVPIAEKLIAIGADWIDQEIARQFAMHVFDEDGTCYLDMHKVRHWRQSEPTSLRNPVGEEELLLKQLFVVMLDRITNCIVHLLNSDQVRSAMGDSRVSVSVAGGPAHHAGFANLLTERFIEHKIADRIDKVRIADQPETAVVRGALIRAEVESMQSDKSEQAA